MSRACSICNQIGHSKRHCLLRKKEEGIVIQTHHEVAPSHHIISLRKNEDVRPWDLVPIYTEPEHKEPKRVTVDLAALVRAETEASSQVVDIFAEEPEGEKEEVPPLVAELASEYTQPTETTSVFSSQPVFEQEIAKSFPSSPIPLPPVSPVRKMRRSLFSWAELRASIETTAWRRIAAGATAFIVLLTVPMPVRGYVQRIRVASHAVVEESTTGFMALQSSTVAALGSDIPKAGEDLTRALQAFDHAQGLLGRDYRFILEVGKWLPIVGRHIEDRQNLLEAGQHIALGNTYMLKGVQEIAAQKEKPFTDRLGVLRAHLRSALPQYEAASKEFEAIEPASLPEEYRETFREARTIFTAFVGDIREVIDLTDALLMLLGEDSFKRYLIVFQNHHELRPTGGFVGSFAILDVQKGKIERITVPGGGSYDLQGQLGAYIRPPVPLQLANGRFEFQDANWWPDFSVSGEKLAWFYEKSRQETVDGVIAVNASVLERVLEVLGPVENKEFQLSISAYNALPTLQKQVEEDYDKVENQPKAVLSGILDSLLKELPDLGKGDMVKLLAEGHDALRQKEIQIYLRDERLQEKFRSFGWTGELASVSPGQDYLLVVNANIQGEKSDASVVQTITHEARIAEDGSVENTVTILRRHTGTLGTKFYGAPNVSYVRVYVPWGSTLVETNGFRYPPENAFKVPEAWYEKDPHVAMAESHEVFDKISGTSVSEDGDKTVFGNWLMVMPGDTVEAKITYRLPYKVGLRSATQPTNRFEVFTESVFGKKNLPQSEYTLLVQKQSGVNSTFRSKIFYPKSWIPLERGSDEQVIDGQSLVQEEELATDHFVGAIFERAYE